MTATAKETASLSLQCAVHDGDRRCRNKFAAHVPVGHHTRAMCHKHADEEARKILAENKRLVWGIVWARWRGLEDGS